MAEPAQPTFEDWEHSPLAYAPPELEKLVIDGVLEGFQAVRTGKLTKLYISDHLEVAQWNVRDVEEDFRRHFGQRYPDILSHKGEVVD